MDRTYDVRLIGPLIAFPFLIFFIAFGGSAEAVTSDSASYHYYSNGRLESITYQNGTVITYTHDNAGNRVTVVTSCSGNGC